MGYSGQQQIQGAIGRQSNSKRKRTASLDLPTLPDYFKRSSLHAVQDQFQADLEQAIQLSLTESTGHAQSSSSGEIPGSQQLCPVCSRCFAGQSTEGFTRHVNHCLDADCATPAADQDEATQAPAWTNVPEAVNMTAQDTPLSQQSDDTTPAQSSEDDTIALEQPTGPISASGTQATLDEQPTQGPFATSEKKKKPVPFYKWIQDTPYTVDAFSYGAIAGCAGYFLSHFHADHYTRLRKSWTHGIIYCSKITANLVRQVLRVDEQYICVLAMDQEHTLSDTVTVSLIDANHCPGAVLFLFKVVGHDGRVARHLHTGDFRANPRMCLHPLIKGVPIDTLYLDTTYLNGSFTFPSQEQAIQAAWEATERVLNEPLGALEVWLQRAAGVIAPSNTPSKTLVVVGTYLVGKEKVFYHIAKRLGSKVYVSDRKRQIMACLENRELEAMLTDDPLEAQVHAIPIMNLKKERLEKYLKELKPAFTSIVALRPTGWSFRGGSKAIEQQSLSEIAAMRPPQEVHVKPQQGSSRRIRWYGVPYSEHSSYLDLARFISSVQVERIVPTVNMASESSRAKMYDILERWQQEKRTAAVASWPTADHHW